MQSPSQSEKIVSRADLGPLVASLRAAGKSIATLNGSFDLLHAGHLHILREAAAQADVFLLALNSDDSVRGYKGKNRPIVALPHRLEMVAALSCVDYVTWFDDPDPRALLEEVRPDVHVNGAEYGADCLEAKTVERFGGRVHIVELVPGLSTSQIVERCKQCD